MIHKKLGRKPLVESSPSLIQKAVEFIKFNGYSAHACKRNSIGSLGASFPVVAVQQHFIKTIPALTDISKTAVSYYFTHQQNLRNLMKDTKDISKEGFLQNKIICKRKTVILITCFHD